MPCLAPGDREPPLGVEATGTAIPVPQGRKRRSSSRHERANKARARLGAEFNEVEFRDRRRAQAARRRDKKARRLEGPSCGDKIAVLAQVVSATDTPGFAVRMNEIKERMEGSLVDYVDSSPLVQAMAHEVPPRFMEVTDAMFLEDEKTLAAHGLEGLYQSKVERLKYRGLSKAALSDWLHSRAPHRVDDIMDLMENGQRLFMQPGWKVNGGSDVQNSRDYFTHKIVVEHAAAKLHAADRSVLLRAAVATADVVARLHFSPLLTAIKASNPNRVCVHMSKGTLAAPSYNAMVDLERHLRAYPRDPLPSLGDIATMLCQLRQRFPDAGFLHAAVVDVASAYQQFFLSYEKFLVVWTKFQIMRDGLLEQLLQGNVVGTFGDKGAGDTWGAFSRLLDELHNAISELWASKTYVDDTVMAAAPVPSNLPPGRDRRFFTSAGGSTADPAPGCPGFCAGVEYAIHSAVIEHRENVARLFGKGSTEDKKVTLFIGRLVALGWEFDLRYSHWCVFPKAEKLEKIAHWLFNVVQADTVQTSILTMQQLCGLLCWFSAGIPFGKSFVYSLFQCRRSRSGRVFLSRAAQRDLTFWRALIRMALEQPQLVACPLQLLRSDRPPERFIVTDACTGTGGGGWLADSPSWSGGPSCHFFVIRWSKGERAAIRRNVQPIGAPESDAEWSIIRDAMRHHCVQGGADIVAAETPLSINVLEFATAVYAILLYAPLLLGHVVSIGTDNTACLCWLVRNKASSGVADALLKILSLVCTVYSIKLVAHHVPGVVNYISDWISRADGLEDYDPRTHLVVSDLEDPQTFLTTVAELISNQSGPDPFNRMNLCRLILEQILTLTDELPTELLVGAISHLHKLPGVPSFGNCKVRAVIDGVAEVLAAGDDFSGIPMDVDDALIVFDPEGEYRLF